MATTKKDLINRIAESTGCTHIHTKAVVQEFFKEIISELAKGNRLEFRDFGVFATRTSPARTTQNPRTLERVEVPARRRVAFKPGKLMKLRLNGSRQARHSNSQRQGHDPRSRRKAHSGALGGA